MKRQSTLEKLAKHYQTRIKIDSTTSREFVSIATPNGFVHVIDNSMTEKGTLLIATDRDFSRIRNNKRAFAAIVQAIDTEESRGASYDKG